MKVRNGAKFAFVAMELGNTAVGLGTAAISQLLCSLIQKVWLYCLMYAYVHRNTGNQNTMHWLIVVIAFAPSVFRYIRHLEEQLEKRGDDLKSVSDVYRRVSHDRRLCCAPRPNLCVPVLWGERAHHSKDSRSSSWQTRMHSSARLLCPLPACVTFRWHKQIMHALGNPFPSLSNSGTCAGARSSSRSENRSAGRAAGSCAHDTACP